MTNYTRERIAEINPDAVLFEEEYYDAAILGLDNEDRVVYDLNKMITAYMAANNADYIDAVEWIEYNTLRSLPYIEASARPVVLTLSFADQPDYTTEI